MNSSVAPPDLSRLSVGDVMSRGVLTCAPETPVAAVAGTMALRHVHSVAVLGERRAVTALDVLAGALHDPYAPVGSVPQRMTTVEPHESLMSAAALMIETGEGHLLVVRDGRDDPVGVVSSLDVAASYAARSAHAARSTMGATARPALVASDLRELRVEAAMHTGVIVCQPETSVADVAASLVEHHMHCVAVFGRPWGVWTDLEVVAAIVGGRTMIGRSEPVPWADAGDRLRAAALLMTGTRSPHLFVGDRERGPVGVISTLDVLQVIAAAQMGAPALVS